MEGLSMDARPVGRIDGRVNSLEDLRLEGQTLDRLIGTIGRLAVESLSGWDAAATSLATGDEVATYGATDDRVNPVDQAQYDAGKGPCVDALNSGESQYFDGNTVPARWRQFAKVASDHQVYSVLSLPLKLGGESVGAINLYSSERDALRPGHREEGSLFAAQAAITVANARDFIDKEAQVAQLEEALQTRTMIGQATGLVMAQEGLSSDEAFQKLVKVSQKANIKLREIAQDYIETWSENMQPPGENL